MPGVFINYRRHDAVGDVNRIDERLIKVFHDDDVFFDQRSLKTSQRFDVALVERVRACDVFIALVGPNWMVLADDGTPRICQEGDYVRGEIAEALKAPPVPIIPVLLRGAAMPSPEALPEDIREFALLQAHIVYERRFDEGVGELIGKIRGVFRVPRSAVRRAFLLYRPRRLCSALVWIGFGVSLLLAVSYTIGSLNGLGRGFVPVFETIGAAFFAAVAAVFRLNAARADRVRSTSS